MTRHQVAQFSLPVGRIGALSDGVFAIAMTLLVLDIRVPVLGNCGSNLALTQALIAMWPKMLGYVTSFIILGIYWVAHHLHFISIHRADRNVLWLNVLFLMFISALPFSTALISEYGKHQVAVVIYGANLIMISLTLQLHWSYATYRHRLVDAHLDQHLIKSVTRIILMGPAFYAIAILLSGIDTRLSIGIYMFVNLLYILPNGMHTHLRTTKVPVAVE